MMMSTLKLMTFAVVVCAAHQATAADVGVINGISTVNGQWDGVAALVCNPSPGVTSICSASFIHPQVLLTAAHCCPLCPSSPTMVTTNKSAFANPTIIAKASKTAAPGDATNDICLVFLDRSVKNVPIYEVSAVETTQGTTGTIVGYGVNQTGQPPTVGSGTQRKGTVSVQSVQGHDIVVVPGPTHQNACHGDSGGPLFVAKGSSTNVVVAGDTASGSSPTCSVGAGTDVYYTSAVFNKAWITSTTKAWLGGDGVVPGRCPVSTCCYSETCR